MSGSNHDLWDATGRANENFYAMMRRPPPTGDVVERARALQRCLLLQRVIERSTFSGERDNAQAALDRLMAKHGITADELGGSL